MTPGAKVALALWLIAVVWDLVCSEGQTVSHGLARGINGRYTRIPVSAAILATAAHLFLLARAIRKVDK